VATNIYQALPVTLYQEERSQNFIKSFPPPVLACVWAMDNITMEV